MRSAPLAAKRDLILTILQVLEIAHAARTEVVLAVDGLNGGQMDANDDIDDDRRVRNFGGPSKEAIDKFVSHGKSGFANAKAD